MLQVKNIKKEFTKQINKKESVCFYANDDISFTAKEGEIIGILGPNGAGKTTLLRIIAGIMKPTSGIITIDKEIYDNNSILIKKKIAFLSGNTKLYKDISPYELLKMCGEYYNVDNNILEKRIKEITKKFDMESFIHQKIENLSTGQYQRTSIARCLVHNPKYYILDEANKCILYSTHYMEEAENICDKIIMINKGKIIATGTPKEIKKQTKTNNLRDSFFSLIGGLNE